METSFSLKNPHSLHQFERHARAYINTQQRSDTYSYKVSMLLLHQLKSQSPGIEIVADHLTMSVRSLQMKLKDEGTSYQKILNSVRKSLAIAYLRERKVSKGEIARLLGFSEISVFSRTFKKWTGKSPSEYQAAYV